MLSRGGLFLFWVFKLGFIGDAWDAKAGDAPGDTFEKVPPGPPSKLLGHGEAEAVHLALKMIFPFDEKENISFVFCPERFLKIPKKLFAKSFFGGVRGSAPHSPPPINPNLPKSPRCELPYIYREFAKCLHKFSQTP